MSDALTVPLVLHGGSGLTADEFKDVIRCGISKVNIFTDINNAAAIAAHKGYSEGKGMTDLMPLMINAVKNAAIEKMQIFNCKC